MNNIQQLTNLSIFELRDLARKVGVYSPTLLKKDDLIEQIQAIFDGKMAPHKSKTKQGRPPKNISGYDNIVNVFLPKDLQTIETAEEQNLQHFNLSGQVLELHQDLAQFDYVSESVNSGFLEILSNKNGILRKNIAKNTVISTLIYVSLHLIETYNLKAGDEIVGNTKFVSLDKPMILTNIITINNIPTNIWRQKRLNFEDLQYKASDRIIKLSDNKNDIWSQIQQKFAPKFGQNVYLYTNNNSQSIKTFINFMQNINTFNNNIKIVYLNPSIITKDIENVKKVIGAELFCADFSESFNIQQKICFLAVNRVKRLAETGSDVIFVVDDVCAVAKYSENKFGLEMMVAKNVLNVAKDTDVGSITILTALPKQPSTALQEQILNTFNRLEDIALYTSEGDQLFDLDKSRTN